MKATVFNIILALLIAALLIPAAFMNAFAQPGSDDRDGFKGGAYKSRYHDHQGARARMKTILGPEACADIKAARLAVFKETAGLRKEIKLGRAELKVLMLKDETTRAQLLAKHDQVTAKAGQLREVFLLNRLEMLRKYPNLSLVDQGKAKRKGARKASAKHKRNRAHKYGFQAGHDNRALHKGIKAQRLEFFKSHADLIRRIQLARVQLKALTLDPAVAKEAVVEKFRHLAGLTAQLQRAKMIKRWQMKQNLSQTALSRTLLPEWEIALEGEV